MPSCLRRLWEGPTTKAAFVETNTTTTVSDLADLVEDEKILLSEVDPSCRSEVEAILVERLS